MVPLLKRIWMIPSPHRCSEPTAQICPIQKRSRGFRSGGTPTGGSQRPAKVIQPEKIVQLKGSTESPKVITCETEVSWRVITTLLDDWPRSPEPSVWRLSACLWSPWRRPSPAHLWSRRQTIPLSWPPGHTNRKASLINLSKQNQAGPVGTSANDAASVMSLSSLQIRLHSSRDTCSTSLSPPFSCSCTAVTKRIADREPGSKQPKIRTSAAPTCWSTPDRVSWSHWIRFMYLFWTWPQRDQQELAKEHQNTLLHASGPWSCTWICLEPHQGACFL